MCRPLLQGQGVNIREVGRALCLVILTIIRKFDQMVPNDMILENDNNMKNTTSLKILVLHLKSSLNYLDHSVEIIYAFIFKFLSFIGYELLVYSLIKIVEPNQNNAERIQFSIELKWHYLLFILFRFLTFNACSPRSMRTAHHSYFKHIYFLGLK